MPTRRLAQSCSPDQPHLRETPGGRQAWPSHAMARPLQFSAQRQPATALHSVSPSGLDPQRHLFSPRKVAVSRRDMELTDTLCVPLSIPPIEAGSTRRGAAPSQRGWPSHRVTGDSQHPYSPAECRSRPGRLASNTNSNGLWDPALPPGAGRHGLPGKLRNPMHALASTNTSIFHTLHIRDCIKYLTIIITVTYIIRSEVTRDSTLY